MWSSFYFENKLPMDSIDLSSTALFLSKRDKNSIIQLILENQTKTNITTLAQGATLQLSTNTPKREIKKKIQHKHIKTLRRCLHGGG
jgi:predicted transcriptional regulator